MGASKTYMSGVRWQGKNTSRGSEGKYTSKPIMKAEGSHMSGENDSLRKGAKSGGGKSGTISGPKKRSSSASGY